MIKMIKMIKCSALMNDRHGNGRPTSHVSLGLACLASIALARAGVAQTNAPSTAGGTREVESASLAVVTGERVHLRSGAADSYYPFGTLERGDVVKVIGEKHNWARVRTEGPAFREFFAYIRYPKTDTGRFRVEPDGRTGRTLGLTRVLAPNLNTNYEPNDSWKRILLLDADARVTVLETTETERTVVHKIVIPAAAEGWINTSFLEPADARQIAAWNAAVKRGTALADGAAAATPSQRPQRLGAAGPEWSAPTPETAAIDDPRDTTVAEATAPSSVDADGRAGLEEAERELARWDVGGTQETTIAAPTPADLEPTIEIVTEQPTIVVLEETPTADDATTQLEPVDDVTIETVTVEAPAPLSPEEALRDLEAAYKRLRQEPIETAEVRPLRALYLALAANGTDEHVARYAAARAEQLSIWADLQQRREEIDRVRRRVHATVQDSEAVGLTIETAGIYTAVGRLAASTVFDGVRRPRLYRVQDAGTGRTIAYLRPERGFDLAGMLGQVVGVVGPRAFETDLRVNLVDAKRIDLIGG